MTDRDDLERGTSPAQDWPRPRRTRWLLILGLVGGSILVIVGAIVGFGALFLLTAKDLELRDSDRDIVVSANDLAEFLEGFVPDPNAESLTKLRYFDGSVDVEYEYDDVDSDDAPYINCVVTADRNLSDAKTTYRMSKIAGNVGMSLAAEVELVAMNDFYAWGDQSSYTSIETDLGKLGLHFLARHGTKTFDLTLAGVYFEEPEDFDEFVSPALSALTNYEP